MCVAFPGSPVRMVTSGPNLFLTGFHYVDLAVLELTGEQAGFKLPETLLAQSPECWDTKQALEIVIYCVCMAVCRYARTHDV